MDYILYFYLIFVLYFGYKISKAGALYIYSPYISIYLSFAAFDIIPLIWNIHDAFIPENLKFVTVSTACVHMVLMLLFRKDLLSPNIINYSDDIDTFKHTRHKYIIICFIILILTGFITGNISGLLNGSDVENSRRANEVGIGFIRDIPLIGLPFLFLTYLFERKESIKTAGIKSSIYGLILFICTAARGSIQQAAYLFLAWLGITKKNLKLWQYIVLMYLIAPIVSFILKAVRSASSIDHISIADNFFEHQNMIFNSNTLKIMYFVGEDHLLYGYSYYYSIVKIIPRFLWPEKPVSIDYYYKQMLDLDFDGGGIYTTMPNDFYINFGYISILPYTLWILALHYMYRKLTRDNNYYLQIVFVIFLLLHYSFNSAIADFEVFILFMLVNRFVYKKSKVF